MPTIAIHQADGEPHRCRLGMELYLEEKKGFKKVQATERTIFNDEEQRRYNFVHAAFTI